ncbi:MULTISPECIES: hypothetical protein [unclassified Rhizobium]|uniref:hypothetical protein n=1 Tax=unclassified Rhizobium TaxID=2613769 RepID=UPI00247A7020|nr:MULTISPECIES: hypothetical protein [unclassified Rhizobium]MDH7800086.1 hypothetical protein [Rhizobium sp. AN70]
MAEAPKSKEFKPGRGYAKADWDAVEFPEMTDEELANAHPARDVLPPAFFKAVDAYRDVRRR